MKKDYKTFIVLHIMIFLYSCGSVLSKTAAGSEFLSIKFCLCYAGFIVTLGIYAIGWQQVIKRMPLTTAFANKAVTIVWGLLWGMLLFDEDIKIGKIIGAIIVIAGVILFVTEKDEEVTNEQ